jgi:hypothetical protein
MQNKKAVLQARANITLQLLKNMPQWTRHSRLGSFSRMSEPQQMVCWGEKLQSKTQNALHNSNCHALTQVLQNCRSNSSTSTWSRPKTVVLCLQTKTDKAVGLVAHNHQFSSPRNFISICFPFLWHTWLVHTAQQQPGTQLPGVFVTLTLKQTTTTTV